MAFKQNISYCDHQTIAWECPIDNYSISCLEIELPTFCWKILMLRLTNVIVVLFLSIVLDICELNCLSYKHRKNCECCPGHYLIVR